MKNNLNRNKLLKTLFKLRSEKKKSNNPIPANEIGLTFNEINDLLKIDHFKRELIMAELWNSKEIISFEHKMGNGCFISDIGTESFSSKKYINKIIFKTLKVIGYIGGLTYFLIKIYEFFNK
jgi:hypothetical protein